MTIFSKMLGFFKRSPQKPERGSAISRRRFLRLMLVSGYGGGLILLDRVWYSQQERSQFHLFDDKNEWLQMDKAGHAFTSWHLSRLIYTVWPQLRPHYAALGGFGSMLPIEIMDAFMPTYGASLSDLAANALGSIAWAGNSHAGAPIKLRYGFSPSVLAKHRPGVLGNSTATQIIKDYNAQSYWISVPLNSLWEQVMPPEIRPFLKHLRLGVGYGAGNMLYARTAHNLASGRTPYRQFYLSPDLDWEWLRPYLGSNTLWIYFVADMWRIPLPKVTHTQYTHVQHRLSGRIGQ